MNSLTDNINEFGQVTPDAGIEFIDKFNKEVPENRTCSKCTPAVMGNLSEKAKLLRNITMPSWITDPKAFSISQRP